MCLGASIRRPITAITLSPGSGWRHPGRKMDVAVKLQPLPTEPYGQERCDRYVSLRFSVNLDRHSHGNLINYSSRVPVCQPDASVAAGTTDRIRAVGTMNADALLVQTNPDDPNRITWTRCDSVKVAASPSMLQHCFVPAENRHCRDLHNFPSANRRRQAF